MLDHLIEDPTFWVGISLLLFLALILWKKVPGLIAGALDKQIAGIRSEIEQAKALRTEAEVLLARFKKDQQDAAAAARDMVATAEREAKIIHDEAARALEELITRRAAMAENKIAQAEAAAIKDVRKAAVEAATAASARLIAEHLGKTERAALLNDAIDGIGKQIH